MGTHREHGQIGQTGSKIVREVLRQSPESTFGTHHHHDGVARLMRTFQSFKQILALFTPEQTSHHSRNSLHPQNRISILNGSCISGPPTPYYPSHKSKVTSLNHLNLDAPTLLFDSIPRAGGPSSKPIKLHLVSCIGCGLWSIPVSMRIV